MFALDIFHRFYEDFITRNESLEKKELEIIAQWKPAPLVSQMNNNTALVMKNSILEGKPGKKVQIDGLKYLNFSSHNYFGFAGNEEIEEEVTKCIKKYGVGTCGCRVFLGMLTAHFYYRGSG